ncbi:hypothetical protein [Bifidobacterium magnum]|uniref:Uncharacterized protein n=1 Tax=Bifidobacterium magnum TaxID=1692 RepID=A0A087B6A1_9BIFI|nr:hypothetical protein [Bifidobacterium magnum]KFI66551.1 hypothetical protein BMAGN_1460 [Bifidobacterium magnum]
MNISVEDVVDSLVRQIGEQAKRIAVLEAQIKALRADESQETV